MVRCCFFSTGCWSIIIIIIIIIIIVMFVEEGGIIRIFGSIGSGIWDGNIYTIMNINYLLLSAPGPHEFISHGRYKGACIREPGW